MEQLVWAIIIVIFIIFTALKNRARNNPDTTVDRTTERDKLSRYMEKIFGIEIPETKPQARVEREEPLETRVEPVPELIIEKKIGKFDSALTRKYERKRKASFSGKRGIRHKEFPWGNLSRKELPNAIIFAEIVGPPISKRKGHRLF